jgi:hypothetical protein
MGAANAAGDVLMLLKDGAAGRATVAQGAVYNAEGQ